MASSIGSNFQLRQTNIIPSLPNDGDLRMTMKNIPKTGNVDANTSLKEPENSISPNETSRSHHSERSTLIIQKNDNRD